MQKFENVDILACLDAVMKQNTGFYQSDFEIDKKIIHEAAASPDREDKTLLWLSRPSGTHCFRERDVFLKDTRPYNTWKFHGEQTRDRILAYAMELTGRERGKIRGNLYELDYAAHFRHVREQALPADTVTLFYERGERSQPTNRYLGGSPDPQHGAFLRFEVQPNAPEALRDLLQEERRSREQLSPGDFKAHIAALRDGLIEAEARRIVAEMKRQYSPNSPNKTHYMTELAPAFMMLASSRDVDRLFSLLPYKSLTFSKIEGRHGIYALIDKNENRDRDIRKPRPLYPGAACRRQKESRSEAGGKNKTSRNGGMSMNRFTVEETNLISIYIADTRRELIGEMSGALPYMDGEMRELALRTLAKLRAMSDADFAALAVSAADEV